MRTTSLLILLSTGISLCSDFFIQEELRIKNPPTAPSLRDTLLGNTPASHVLQLGTQPQRRLSANLFGNNANAYMGSALMQNPQALRDIKATGIKFMRLPGGNWSNMWLWDHQVPAGLDPAYVSQIKGAPTVSWTMKTTELYDLADSIGAYLQPCVNYSMSRYFSGSDSVSKAASYAASWVRDLKNKGRKAPYWEVGNENYGSWQSGFVVRGDTLGGDDYGRDFRVFADSMKAANPDIKIGAVLYPESGGQRSWSAKVLPELQGKADFLIIHEYFTFAKQINDVSADQVLASIDLIAKERDSLDNMMRKYLPSGSEPLPIMVSEYNLRCGMKEITFLAPVFQTMALNEFARYNMMHVNLWDLANSYSTDGDKGMFSRKHPTWPDYTPYPSFYGYWLMSKWMGQEVMPLSSDEKSIHWYSTRYDNGAMGIIAVNPTKQAQSFQIQSQSEFKQLQWQILSADSLLANEVRINGIGSNAQKAGPENYEQIPHYQAPWSSQSTLEIPAMSILYGALIPQEKITSAISLQIEHGNELQVPTGFYARISKANGQIVLETQAQKSTLNLHSLGLGQGNYQVQICRMGKSQCSTAQNLFLGPAKP